MKLLVLVALLVALIAGYSAWNTWQDYQWERRASAYAVLFPKGTTRKVLEESLDARGTRYRRDYRCVTEYCDLLGAPPIEDGPADLVAIGDLSGTIACAAGSVYVAFEFKSLGARFTTEPSPSDLLKGVTVYKLSGGCL